MNEDNPTDNQLVNSKIEPENTDKSNRWLYLSLGLGLAAYGLVLFISKEASFETILISGIGALFLISFSIWAIWHKEPHGEI